MVLERTRLDGKVAIITGGGRGLGKAMATSLAEAGAEVCLAARTESQLLDAAAEIKEISGKEALLIPTDVRDSAQCTALIERTRDHFGRLDILMNNAGGGNPRTAGLRIWE